MKDLSYFQLRAELYPREQNQSVAFKLKELENIWFCTPKNVKRKLRKFEQEGHFDYAPGQGRGHRSTLRFHQLFQVEIENTVQLYINHEQMEDLMQLLQLPIPKSWVANVSEDIQTLFGLQSSSEKKDILRSVTRGITTLDPLYTSVTFESFLIHQLGDTLVAYDDKTDKIYPHLAHHWIVDDRYREWTFYLRKGVRFHHQRILNSEDVLYTFNRFRKGTPYDWLLKDIEKIECPHPYKVTFHLKRANPFFLRFVSCYNLAILPKDIPFDERQWIGTGPFKLKERSDQKLVLEAFDHYFLERPLLDEVQFWKMPRESSASATFQIDGQEESETLQEKQEIEKGFRFLAFNFRKPTIIHNPAFRETIFHLLDVNKMHKDLGRDRPTEASSYFPSRSCPQKKDRSKVKQLLEASGYQGEKLTFFSPEHPKGLEEAHWFVKEAEKEGVRLDHKTFNLDELYSKRLENNADLLFMGEVASNDLLLSFMGVFYNEALIFRRFFRKEDLHWIESRLEKLQREQTPGDQEKRMDEIETYVKENNLIVFMHHPLKRRTLHPMIRSIHFESFGHIDLRRLWIS